MADLAGVIIAGEPQAGAWISLVCVPATHYHCGPTNPPLWLWVASAVAKRQVRGTQAKPVNYLGKHQVVKDWDKKAIKGTKSGDAIFMPGLPLTRDEMAMLYVDVNIKTIPPDRDPDDVATYWIEMPYDVGASNGVVTRYILIKRDSNEVHARPISEHELRQNFKVKL